MSGSGKVMFFFAYGTLVFLKNDYFDAIYRGLANSEVRNVRFSARFALN